MNKFMHGPLAAMNRADAAEREQLQQVMRKFMAAWEGERDGQAGNHPNGDNSG